MKTVFFWLILALLLLAISCDPSVNEEPGIIENPNAFVIHSRSPSASDTSDRDFFEAVNIATKQGTPVFAIHETGGRIYLPIMSSYPECNRKVVEGYIQPDGFDKHAVFVTTKILRDTTVSTVGN